MQIPAQAILYKIETRFRSFFMKFSVLIVAICNSNSATGTTFYYLY